MLWSQIPLPPCDGEASAEFKILCCHPIVGGRQASVMTSLQNRVTAGSPAGSSEFPQFHRLISNNRGWWQWGGSTGAGG